MATFLVESFLPSFGGERLEELARRAHDAAAALRARGTRVRPIGYILLPDEETAFCLVEAPTLRAVRDLVELARIDADRIVEAVLVAPADGSALGPTGSSTRRPPRS